MNTLEYQCGMCGTCCYEIPGEYNKRIPLYPEEVDKLIEIAKERNVPFLVIEDIVFPDLKNKSILVITYRIRLDNPNSCCPFYDLAKGCTVHNYKPMACQAYPLALKQIDSFRFELTIDPLCNYIIKNYEVLQHADIEKLKSIFKDEYPKAEKFYKKNKKLMLKIRQLEVEDLIKIPSEINLEDLLKQLASSAKLRSDIDIKLEIKGKWDPEIEVKESIYRIIQESLNNIIKHSEADKANIRLNLLKYETILEIEDNGKGFDIGSVSKKKFGLFIMKERAKSLNASLQIKSRKEQGTNITLIYKNQSKDQYA